MSGCCGLRILKDNQVVLLRPNRDIEEILDRLMEREGEERLWQAQRELGLTGPCSLSALIMRLNGA